LWFKLIVCSFCVIFSLKKEDQSIPHLLEKLQSDNGRLTRAAVLLFGKDPQKFYISSIIRAEKILDDVTPHYSIMHTQLKIYPDQLILWNNGEPTGKLTIEGFKKNILPIKEMS